MMKAKRNTALKAGRRANSSVADLKEQIERQARELDEARERETAAAEVLRVISSFPGDLKPVFEAIISNAQRICGARFGNLVLFDGKNMRVVAMHNAAPEHMAMRQRDPIVPLEKSILGPLVRTKMLVHVADITAEEPYTSSALARVGGMRTALAVPMLRDDELVGAIGIYNNEVRPFTDKQIALLTNFAAQAVIAIENTRLLNELRQRTDDLSEALEQQTTTADILTVISNSLDDTQPVFEAIVQSGLKLFADATIQVSLADGDKIRLAAVADRDPARANAMRRIFPIPLTREYMNGVAILDGRVVDVPDAENAPPELAIGARNFLATGNRAVTVMPMMRGQMPIGALQVVRLIPGPLSDKQREVLRTFANQAVIAIENTRLLNELRQSLEQQTATAEVLRVINSSPGELEPVFQAMLENATRLCEAEFGNLFLYDGEAFRTVALYHASQAYSKSRQQPFLADDLHPDVPLVRIIQSKDIIHIADVRTERSYVAGDPEFSKLVDVAGARTLLLVPLLRETQFVGAFAIYRKEVRQFADKQIDLVKNFAAQAVIAIENTRLLNELRQRTADLTQSLENLRTAQDRLVQTAKLASLGQLTAGIAHEIKNPLNFVNNFSGVSVELIDELKETLGHVQADEKTRTDINDLANTLRDNLDKCGQHGKQPRYCQEHVAAFHAGSGEHRPVDVNALVEETLNLAYHGARAEKQGFEITLERCFDPAVGEADLFPQEITRALLNLISNGFYAATKRKAEANGGDYEPTVTATTKNLGNSVEIRIRDNGTGIPPEVKEKLFSPFFTTTPAGEGTGLGLSISHDIIVKQHDGSIEVDTKPGEFTEFRIVLPRAGAPLIKSGEHP